MTHKKPNHQPNFAETIQDVAGAKQKQARQTPTWPGAKEQTEPQHAHAQPVDVAAPGDVGTAPPSKSVYERSEINKRHH